MEGIAACRLTAERGCSDTGSPRVARSRPREHTVRSTVVAREWRQPEGLGFIRAGNGWCHWVMTGNTRSRDASSVISHRAHPRVCPDRAIFWVRSGLTGVGVQRSCGIGCHREPGRIPARGFDALPFALPPCSAPSSRSGKSWDILGVHASTSFCRRRRRRSGEGYSKAIGIVVRLAGAAGAGA